MAYQQFRPLSGTPPVVKNLIILNCLVFLAQMVLDKQFDLSHRLSLYPANTSLFKPYQLVTHMFAHSTMITHIVFNMLSLWVFGRVLESFWGPKKFFIFYIVCGLVAGGAHLLVEALKTPNIRLVDGVAVNYVAGALGASGAVMGVFAAFAYLFPNTELMMMFIPVPIKAKYMLLIFAALDLFGGLSPVADGVAHWAHLGGGLAGFLMVMYWNRTNKRTLY